MTQQATSRANQISQDSQCRRCPAQLPCAAKASSPPSDWPVPNAARQLRTAIQQAGTQHGIILKLGSVSSVKSERIEALGCSLAGFTVGAQAMDDFGELLPLHRALGKLRWGCLSTS